MPPVSLSATARTFRFAPISSAPIPTGEISLPNGQFGLIASKITSLTIGAASVLSGFQFAHGHSVEQHQWRRRRRRGQRRQPHQQPYRPGRRRLGHALGTGNGVVLEDSSDFDIGGAVRNVFAGIAARAIPTTSVSPT